MTSQPIRSDYSTLFELRQALAARGPQYLQSLFAFDFSKSNKWQGEYCLQGRSLHAPGLGNPYLEILNIIKHFLASFDSDGMIPAYRFGCHDSKDQRVIPLSDGSDGIYDGIDALISGYSEAVQKGIKMSGPTTFAPVIDAAIAYAQSLECKVMILCVIITDGDVSDMRRDVEALQIASNYPIEFIAFGVGDGPFEKMKFFDDLNIRKFDNFQFVNYQIQKEQLEQMQQPEVAIERLMLMEVPDCYEQMKKLGILKE